MAKARRLIGAAMLLVLGGRLLLLPGERVARDEEVQAAYEEYCACVRIHVLCAPSDPCPYPNCMGMFLERSEGINRRHLLLSLVKPRNLLSGWQPYRGYLR
jgi:hypothetical protein